MAGIIGAAPTATARGLLSGDSITNALEGSEPKKRGDCMDGQKLVGGAAVLAAVGMIFYLNNALKQDTSTAMHSIMLHAIHEMRSYPEHRTAIGGMCAAAHESAFAASYSTGGLFGDESFDDAAYVDAFFKSMSSQAQSAGLTQVVQELREVHRNLLSDLNEAQAETDDPDNEADDAPPAADDGAEMPEHDV
jgi:hypothetical protein